MCLSVSKKSYVMVCILHYYVLRYKVSVKFSNRQLLKSLACVIYNKKNDIEG